MTSSKASGQVAALMILEEGAKIISTPVDRVEVTEEGFAGDRHAGKTRRAGGRDQGIPKGTEVPNRRQVSIVSEEELAEIASRLGIPRVKPEWLGANVSLRGVDDLTELAPGSGLKFGGGVELAIEGENSPCRAPGEAIAKQYPNRQGLAARFPKDALHLRGLVGWVEQPGELAVGDSVRIRGAKSDSPA